MFRYLPTFWAKVPFFTLFYLTSSLSVVIGQPFHSKIQKIHDPFSFLLPCSWFCLFRRICFWEEDDWAWARKSGRSFLVLSLDAFLWFTIKFSSFMIKLDFQWHLRCHLILVLILEEFCQRQTEFLLQDLKHTSCVTDRQPIYYMAYNI